MATRDTLAAKAAASTSAANLFAIARDASEAPADMGYAKELLSSAAFTGDAGAKAALDKVAGDAMFTKDFVALAIGYQALGRCRQGEGNVWDRAPILRWMAARRLPSAWASGWR